MCFHAGVAVEYLALQLISLRAVWLCFLPLAAGLLLVRAESRDCRTEAVLPSFLTAKGSGSSALRGLNPFCIMPVPDPDKYNARIQRHTSTRQLPALPGNPWYSSGNHRYTYHAARPRLSSLPPAASAGETSLSKIPDTSPGLPVFLLLPPRTAPHKDPRR